MRRKGMALLAALWLVTLLGSATAAALRIAALASTASENRAALRPAEWARNACWHVALARLAEPNGARGTSHVPLPIAAFDIPSIEIAPRVTCESAVENINARLNVNQARADALRCLLGSPAELVLRLRPFVNDEEMELALRRIGLEETRHYMTTRGDGAVAVLAASPAVVACLPGWDRGAATAIATAKKRGLVVQSTGELVGLLPERSQRSVLAEIDKGATYHTTKSSAYLVTVVGRAGPHRIAARMRLEIVLDRYSIRIQRREVD